MKPYFLQYTISAVVMAENADHAYEVAQDRRREILSEADKPIIDVDGEVVGSWNLRGGWDLQCIPYGGDGNTRIGELIKKDSA